MFLGFGSPLQPRQQVPKGTVVAVITEGQVTPRCGSCNQAVDNLERCDNCNDGQIYEFRYLVAAGEYRRGWRREISHSDHLAYLGTAQFDQTHYTWRMRKPQWTCPLTRLQHRRQWRSLIVRAHPRVTR